MKKTADEIRLEMIGGKIDPNNVQLFLPLLIKGCLYDLRNKVKLRGEYIPHLILNTGDDISYLEVKGQDASIEPQQISNEDFVYQEVPRCVVKPGSVSIDTGDLTNPYARGNFDFEDGENFYTYNAEFRRFPLKISLELNYLLDSYTDLLALSQELITTLAFVNTFRIIYLGQEINCSYNFGDSVDQTVQFDIDGLYTDSKLKQIPVTVEVETSFPVYRPRTVISTDKKIASLQTNLNLEYNDEIDELSRTIE